MSRKQAILWFWGVTTVYCLILTPWFAWEVLAQEGLSDDNDRRQTV